MKKTILIFIICISSVCFGQVKYTYFSKAELEQDLDFFSEQLTSIHPLFLDKDFRGKWEANFSGLKHSLRDSMTQNEFYLMLAPHLTSLNDGHTGFAMPYKQRVKFMESGGLSFPFAVRIRDHSIYISQYFGDDRSLFDGGEEILQINGIDVSDMLSEMVKLFGGSSIYSRHRAVAYGFRYYVWMLYGMEKDYELLIKNKQGQTTKVFVEGVTKEEFKRNFKAYPSIKKEPFSFSIDKQNKTSLLKIKSFGDLKGFCAFADSAFQAIAENRIENLIIDVCGNGGGRSVVVDSLMNYITDKAYAQYSRIETRISQALKDRYKVRYPERFESINAHALDELLVSEGFKTQPRNNKRRFKGNLFLLTDRASCSAAATFAGVFKELKLGPIIGEETGEKLEYFGDYWNISTPNTSLTFYIAPKKFVQYGGTDLKKGVLPDYIVTNKEDSIVEFAYDLIRKESKANKL